MCQIIHRTALTQESIEALLLAVDVLKLVVDGAREQLHSNMQAKIKGNSEVTYSNNMLQNTSTPVLILEPQLHYVEGKMSINQITEHNSIVTFGTTSLTSLVFSNYVYFRAIYVHLIRMRVKQRFDRMLKTHAVLFFCRQFCFE